MIGRYQALLLLIALALGGLCPRGRAGDAMSSPLFKIGHPQTEPFVTSVQGYGALSPNKSHVAVYVSKQDAFRLRTGLRAEVHILPPNQPATKVSGKVSSILRGADPRTGQAIVTIRIPEQKLPARTYADVSIDIMRKEALALPATAVIVEEGKNYVVREDPAKPGTFEKVEIQVGVRNPAYTEIRGGVTASDKVLTEGALEWLNRQEGGAEDDD